MRKFILVSLVTILTTIGCIGSGLQADEAKLPSTSVSLEHKRTHENRYPGAWTTFKGMDAEVQCEKPTVWVIKASAQFDGNPLGLEFGLRVVCDGVPTSALAFKACGDGPNYISCWGFVLMEPSKMEPGKKHHLELQGHIEKDPFRLGSYCIGDCKLQAMALADDESVVSLRENLGRGIESAGEALHDLRTEAIQFKKTLEVEKSELATLREKLRKELKQEILHDPYFLELVQTALSREPQSPK